MKLDPRLRLIIPHPEVVVHLGHPHTWLNHLADYRRQYLLHQSNWKNGVAEYQKSTTGEDSGHAQWRVRDYYSGALEREVRQQSTMGKKYW